MGTLSRIVCATAVAALTILSTASAGVNTPHSGWYSGNPLLGPSTLTDLACSGSTCYASGHFGTLLKSKDGGATWAGTVTGLTTDLSRVRLAAGSADRVITGAGCALRRSDDGGETFRRLPFSARDAGCPSGVVSFSFPTENAGYLLLADSRVLATSDGGRSFARRTAVPGGALDLLCTGERTCFTAGPSGIQRTADGGVSWSQAPGTAGNSLAGLEQADALTLYAVGDAQTVLKSTDGGTTWTRKTVRNVPAANFRTIRCGNAFQCLITVDGGSRLVRTIDGGDNYSAVVPSDDRTFAVDFAGSTRAVAAGASGSAEISDDVGVTWRATGSRIAGVFSVLAAVSDGIAYAGGAQGVLARTVDGGQSWVNVSPPSDAPIVGLAGRAPNRLYALAADGTLQRSDNGGTSYSLLGGFTGRPLALHAVGVDGLLLVGPRGVVRSTNGGETFSAVSSRAVRGRALRAADAAGGGAVVVYGARAAAVSSDGGASWTAIRLPRKRAVRDLDFATSRTGYVLDTRGTVWHTTNGGRTWTALRTLGTSGAYALEFSDALRGYVAVGTFGSLRNVGLVLRTADGGRSWHPQLVSRMFVRRLATDGGVDYALADDSELYGTTSGGDVGDPQRLALSARPRALSKRGAVTVAGRLTPADGGEEIVVARLSAGRWSVQRATAAANGAFTTRWRLTRDATFVAQVLGDDDHAGTGTRALEVRVRPAKKRR